MVTITSFLCIVLISGCAGAKNSSVLNDILMTGIFDFTTRPRSALAAAGLPTYGIPTHANVGGAASPRDAENPSSRKVAGQSAVIQEQAAAIQEFLSNRAAEIVIGSAPTTGATTSVDMYRTEADAVVADHASVDIRTLKPTRPTSPASRATAAPTPVVTTQPTVFSTISAEQQQTTVPYVLFHSTPVVGEDHVIAVELSNAEVEKSMNLVESTSSVATSSPGSDPATNPDVSTSTSIIRSTSPEPIQKSTTSKVPSVTSSSAAASTTFVTVIAPSTADTSLPMSLASTATSLSLVTLPSTPLPSSVNPTIPMTPLLPSTTQLPLPLTTHVSTVDAIPSSTAFTTAPPTTPTTDSSTLPSTRLSSTTTTMVPVTTLSTMSMETTSETTTPPISIVVSDFATATNESALSGDRASVVNLPDVNVPFSQHRSGSADNNAEKHHVRCKPDTVTPLRELSSADYSNLLEARFISNDPAITNQSSQHTLSELRRLLCKQLNTGAVAVLFAADNSVSDMSAIEFVAPQNNNSHSNDSMVFLWRHVHHGDAVFAQTAASTLGKALQENEHERRWVLQPFKPSGPHTAKTTPATEDPVLAASLVAALATIGLLASLSIIILIALHLRRRRRRGQWIVGSVKGIPSPRGSRKGGMPSVWGDCDDDTMVLSHVGTPQSLRQEPPLYYENSTFQWHISDLPPPHEMHGGFAFAHPVNFGQNEYLV